MSYDPQHSTLRHFTTATQIRHFENTDGKSYVFDGTHTAVQDTDGEVRAGMCGTPSGQRWMLTSACSVDRVSLLRHL